MTKREAAIVSAYTGVMLGDSSDLHKYVEEIMEIPVWTHQMGNSKIAKEIKQKSKNDFCSIKVSP